MPIKRRNFVKSLGLLATAFPFANYDIFAENKGVSNDKNPKFNDKGILKMMSKMRIFGIGFILVIQSIRIF